MFGLFRPRLPIPAHEIEWQLATFHWLRSAFPNDGPGELVLPTNAWFPVSDTRGHARALELFAATKHAAGLVDWPVELREGEHSRENRIGEALLLQQEGSAPAGTFGFDATDAEHPVITYNPVLIAKPMALVATFAHELAHYLMAAIADPPPGGWKLHELATDLTAVYLGFGVFLANSAQRFDQYTDSSTQGWSMERQGYLSERALLVALALHQAMIDSPRDAAVAHLKPDLQSAYRGIYASVTRRFPDVNAAMAAADGAAFV